MHTVPDTYVAVLVFVLFVAGVASVLAFLRERQRWKKKLERRRN
jgi:formate-dependent nitrite reductase membrane component NrfD